MMGNRDNLRPISLTHDEAMKFGRSGGLASGVASRRRRDVRVFLRSFLEDRAYSGLDVLMTNLNIAEEDRTNLNGLVLRLFDRAIRQGDVDAARTLFEWAGILPNQDRLEAAFLKGSPPASAGKVCEGKKDVIVYDTK